MALLQGSSEVSDELDSTISQTFDGNLEIIEWCGNTQPFTWTGSTVDVLFAASYPRKPPTFFLYQHARRQ